MGRCERVSLLIFFFSPPQLDPFEMSSDLCVFHSTYTGPRTKDTIRIIPSLNNSEDGLDEDDDDVV